MTNATPIYTATAGPVDTAAPARAKSYAVLSGLLGLIPVLTAFSVITSEQGSSIGTFVQAAIGLAGSFGFAFVSHKTNTQIKNGTFDQAPDPVIVTSPPPISLENVAEVRDQLDNVIAGAQNQAQNGIAAALEAVGGLTAFLPGGKPATEGLVSAVDLFQALSGLRK